MTKPVLRFPEDVRDAFARRYRNQHRDWLAGEGAWPLETPLGCPTETEAGLQGGRLREWIEAWRAWRGRGQLLWCERRWRTLGAQSLPERLLLADAQDVAAWIGEDQRWLRACSRYRHAVSRWPAMAVRLKRHFDALAGYADADFVRLEALLAWIEANPRSNIYPRQIPIAGMDTKWLEPRMALVADLLGALQADHERCGLREAPRIVRVRLLDPALRARVGGLEDVAAPLTELAALRLPVSRAYIVENVQTGLCFGDCLGSVLFMGLGYGVGALAQLPWLAAAECVYWGDIDTHGFAILDRARASLPNAVSALMDEATLLGNRDLWVEERDQCAAPDLPLLTAAERSVYRGLKQQRWGRNVRLEQERIAWNEAWEALTG